ncbi:hypothetical protein PBCVNW6652_114L [Paramecium bursaria Chlorella virus NW665.2]|nr:hypothetical protein PBCVNW6652_114L [Paramecium bursaria Chlorella virus NW665.2]
MRLTHMQLILASALALVIVLIVITMLLKKPAKKENFSFGDIFKTVKNVGKKVGEVAKDGFNAAKNVVAPNSFQPTYTNRVLYKNLWACPSGTVDYGDEARQCLTSQYGPQIWRADGAGNWGWACPNGTSLVNTGDWNQKCAKGFSQRKLIGGTWKCYDTEVDTGKTWENSDYYAAQQQCATGDDASFTTRVYDGTNWVCPSGSVDTGFTWNDGALGSKQCRISPGN